ncbi:hypothetical protein QFZ36_002754 [Pseudarthrobacter siccitolerans]|uniref:DUF1593 domain-containing protein n=1 Tax=Pseudarthrobacter siccitolerans TaxID=861266 RepID=A0ABU0PMK4_9MICC|nr:DUF1593 domain-containing protein [Pseudarthrobacter siccitolerans]MDQ0675193.1 hypothetical protein [Pseudarthrobacter siccitolerans]
MIYATSSESLSATNRPRTIIMADPELDDLNSMIRLLLYSNEIRIEGLIYASSRFHWKGDGKGTTFLLPDREYDEPQTSFRWAEGECFIHDAVDAYAEVYANLIVHDPGYPHPDDLRAVIRDGNIEFEGDMSQDSPGSRLIADALLDDEPGLVHLQNWAGTSTMARALRSIEERHSGTPEWQDVRARVSRKAVVTKFSSQDSTYDDYIRPNWPELRVTDVACFAWGYPVRRVVLPKDEYMLSAAWMRENVTSVGPLGALYRVWGDGRQMVEGDYTDFFHLSGHSTEELQEMGYRVWIEPQPAGEWISEGDTPNMLNLLGNGLRGHEHPSFGGWGGRGTRLEEGPDTWALRPTVDTAADGGTPGEYSLTRWFGDAQRDFATRLRWSVTREYAGANHHPEVAVSPGLDVSGEPGSAMTLSASATDPDDDSLSYHWWQYAEAGTYAGRVALYGNDGSEVTLTVPSDGAAGQTIHLILEVEDDAAMPLKRYQRVIVTIE